MVLSKPYPCVQASAPAGCNSSPWELTRHTPPRALLQRRQIRRTACSAIAAEDRLSEQVVVVLGTQWGDEGKGKLVDILARQYDVVARAQVSYIYSRLQNFMLAISLTS